VPVAAQVAPALALCPVAAALAAGLFHSASMIGRLILARVGHQIPLVYDSSSVCTATGLARQSLGRLYHPQLVLSSGRDPS
jgi:hypothetical protein